MTVVIGWIKHGCPTSLAGNRVARSKCVRGLEADEDDEERPAPLGKHVETGPPE
jgi:hypothetical protein